MERFQKYYPGRVGHGFILCRTNERDHGNGRRLQGSSRTPGQAGTYPRAADPFHRTAQQGQTGQNSEQEALKARLKEKTAELEAECAGLFEIASEVRKIIKLEMPQESWKEFGIQAKR